MKCCIMSCALQSIAWCLLASVFFFFTWNKVVAAVSNLKTMKWWQALLTVVTLCILCMSLHQGGKGGKCAKGENKEDCEKCHEKSEHVEPMPTEAVPAQ